jgi:hypothetical protein
MHSPLTKFTASYKEYDICVITAANDYQAQGYRQQLKWREDKGILPEGPALDRREGTGFLVFSDPKGKRIGSGGSTIYVLYKLLEQFSKDEKYLSPEEAFRGKRIVILHSGGDSRRLPAYSAVGKIFTPLPINSSTDGFVTLFDLLLNNLTQLSCLNDGQVIVASGDVLLSFDAEKIVFSDSGVTGLAYPGPVEVASNHGVYVVPSNQSEGNLRKVLDFLQKPTYDELKRCNGLDTANRAFIDTGIMNFSLDAIKVLIEASGTSLEDGEVVTEESGLCRALINGNVQLDIYKEIPFAILSKKVEALSVPQSAFTNALQQIPFFVYLLPYCEFFHIGTSKQLLQNFHTVNYTASAYDFQNFSKSKVIDKSGLENAFVYNSLINTASIKSSGASFIEGCNLEGEVLLEGENILTSIPKGVGNIRLQKGICLTCIPVYNPFNPNNPLTPLDNPLAPFSKGDKGESLWKGDKGEQSVDSGWVSIIYGIEDDFKKVAQRHAPTDDTATFLNNAFISWMEEKGISPTDLWEDDEPQKLWNARLFPVSADPGESMRIALSLQVEQAASLLEVEQTASLLKVEHAASLLKVEQTVSLLLDEWRKSTRMSLRQILESVDYVRFLDNYSTLLKKVNLENLAITLTPKSNLSSEEILSWCAVAEDYNTAIKNTLALIEQSEDILFQARLYKLLSNICARENHRK